MIIEITSLGLLVEETILLLIKQMDTAFKKNNLDISMEEYSLLSVLESNAAFTGAYIGKILNKDGCNVNELLENLIAKNVLQSNNVNDNIFQLHLTAQGREMVKKILETEAQVIQQYLNKTTGSEIQLLTQKVKSIQNKLYHKE